MYKRQVLGVFGLEGSWLTAWLLQCRRYYRCAAGLWVRARQVRLCACDVTLGRCSLFRDLLLVNWEGGSEAFDSKELYVDSVHECMNRQ